MQSFLRSAALVSTFCCFVTQAFSQSNFFTALRSGDLPESVAVPKTVKAMEVFRLDESALRDYLRNAPLEFHNDGATIPLEIPLPDGRTETFALVESPILSPEVAAQNPEIKTYCGNGLTRKQAIIRLSLTAHGFAAILLNVEGGTVYFEKYARETKGVYFNYYTRDAIIPPGGVHSRCGVGPDQESHKLLSPQHVTDRNNSGGTLRTYRLAMAADAEFTAAHGGTQSDALAAVVVYVNTINAVYRNELSVTFTLVNGTNLMYTNPLTDPYTNDDQAAMLTENHNNCNMVLGSGNYDIGHVWGYVGGSGGGIASLEALCDASIKGKGVSGEGDLSSYAQVFMDQLVLHEMGHQFGMTHSYNSNIPVCTTRSQPTSAEPGSGATIMSYGFTCGDDDYFTSFDGNGAQIGPFLQFHTVNYDQAEAYIANTSPGYGGSCVVNTPTGNTPPTVTMPSPHTIPKSTPFALTGSATDPNGDGLTYCWEGTNVGSAATPDPSTLGNTTQTPFFRTYPTPDSSGATRIYPLLSAILNGSNYAKGDKLPSVSITTTHRLTVRDNRATGGGVSYGSLSITIDGSIGPFLVTSNLSGSYPAFSTQTVTWSVNGTATATPNVKISISTDGGLTFSTLIASTPNDGSQVVTLPNTQTTQARLKVEAVGNIFFDISNFDFTISAPLPVELVSFEARLQGKNAAFLTWSTASEKDSRGFQVEWLAENGAAFQTIGFVAGKGPDGAHDYSFSAPDLSAGEHYFRLKQLDTDGSFSFSPVKSVTVRPSFHATVSPNPVQEKLTLQVYQEAAASLGILLVNALGQMTELLPPAETAEGPTEWTFDVSALPAGLYYCLCTTGDGRVETIRVIKQ